MPGLIHGIAGSVGKDEAQGVIHEVHGDIRDVYGESQEENDAQSMGNRMTQMETIMPLEYP